MHDFKSSRGENEFLNLDQPEQTENQEKKHFKKRVENTLGGRNKIQLY